MQYFFSDKVALFMSDKTQQSCLITATVDGIFLKSSCLNYINFRVQSRSYCLLNKERFYYLGCISSLGIEEITPLQYGWMYFLKRHSKMITFIADVSPIHCNTPPIATYYPSTQIFFILGPSTQATFDHDITKIQARCIQFSIAILQ